MCPLRGVVFVVSLCVAFVLGLKAFFGRPSKTPERGAGCSSIHSGARLAWEFLSGTYLWRVYRREEKYTKEADH